MEKKSFYWWGIRKGLLWKAFYDEVILGFVKLYSEFVQKTNKKDQWIFGILIIVILSVMIVEVLKGTGLMIGIVLIFAFIFLVAVHAAINRYFMIAYMNETFLNKAKKAAQNARANTPQRDSALMKFRSITFEFGGLKWTESYTGEEDRVDAAAGAFASVLSNNGVKYTGRSYLD